MSEKLKVKTSHTKGDKVSVGDGKTKGVVTLRAYAGDDTTIPVYHVRFENGEVRHYTEDDLN